jgi:GntR family transcriptional regulator / MocR family aminotransferase
MSSDLFVDPSQPRRTSAMLFEQLRESIATGRFKPGDRLPTSRELAVELGVARSTVTAVYGRLTGEGFVEARIGDGTFVARGPIRATVRAESGQRSSSNPLPLITSQMTAQASMNEPLIDLRTGRPDPTLFPVVDWRRCVNGAVQSAPPGYGDAAGLPALRRALAVWIHRSRGVAATTEQILVTAGAQHAFDLISRTLLRTGDIIAIENPGYPMARRAFERNGLRVIPVPVDHDGIVVEALPSKTRAVYVTPSHQSPTGGTMSAQRRRALLAYADRYDVTIIEDDYDTEFRYVDRPLEPLQRLDGNGRVLYVGTFSKTLSPSLRIGFVVAPEPIVRALTDVRLTIDTQPPHLTQGALATFIATGVFDRHLRRARRVYSVRHALVQERIALLHGAGLIAEPVRSNAGLHNMIALPTGCDANNLVDRLRAQGVAIDTTAEWWVTNAPPPGLMIGFGLAGLAHLDTAFNKLRNHLRRPKPDVS